MISACFNFLTKLTFYLVFILTLVSIQTYSQTIKPNEYSTVGRFFEWADMPVYSSVLYTAVKASDGGWVLGGILDNPLSFMSPPIVIKLSAEGDKEWENIPMNNSWEVGFTQASANCSDGNLLVAGSCMYGCDYGPSGVFIEKYSVNGDKVWAQRLINQNWTFDVQGIFELVNGEIVVISNYLLYKLSADGDSLLNVNYDLEFGQYFNCGFADTNQLLFGHGNNIMITDFDGYIQSEHQFEGNVFGIHRYSDHYYILETDKIVQTDLDLSVINSLKFTSVPIDEFMYGFYENRCIILNKDTLIKINLDSFEKSILGIDIPGSLFVNNVVLDDTTILMAGSSVFDWNKAFSAKTYSLEGQTEENLVDIGVTNIRVENVEIVASEYDENVYTFKWDTWATIHNFGEEQVESFYIGARLLGMNICGFNLYQGYFDQMNIEPGKELEVFLGQISDGGFYIPDSSQFTYPLHIHTIIPNNKLDRNAENDEAETSIIMYVGTNENRIDNFIVFPNPAKSVVSIRYAPVNSLWKLTNLKGITIAKGIVHDQIIQLDISNLSKGIYFFILTNDADAKHVRKIVVN